MKREPILLLDEESEEIWGRAFDRRLLLRLYHYIRPHRPLLILSLVLLPSVALFQLAQPLLIKLVIDTFLTQDPSNGILLYLKEHFTPKEGILFLSLIFFAALSLEHLFRALQLQTMQKLGSLTMRDLRQDVYDHTCRLPMTFLDKQPVGRLVTRATNDIEALQEMFVSGLVTVVGDLALLMGIVIVLFSLSWKLALVVYAIVPILLLATWYFRMQIRSAFRDIRIRIAKINAFLSEQISGMSVIRLFNRETANFAEFDKINKAHYRAHLRSISNDAILYSIVEAFGSIAIGLMIWYGGGRQLTGELTLGTLVAFIGYIEKFFGPIRDLSSKYTIMQGAIASLEKIFEILDTPSEKIRSLPQKLKTMRLRGEIEFENVTFSYNDNQHAVQHISFSVSPGEMLALVGATGAGKSTLIKLLNRFYRNASGTIQLDGCPVEKLDLDFLRPQIGYIQQDAPLFNDTVAYNISLGRRDMTLKEIEEAARKVSADRFIQRLPQRYNEIISEGGTNLSAGERQLIAFARVILYDPPILVFDEATSNIDVETESLLQRAIETVTRNRTTIVIAHRLSTICCADQILVMHKGEIKERGKHEELLRSGGLYQTLYELQFQKASSSHPKK
ncbi:MAG: ABC transporter ATP-binding protein [Deltaproteobacteria bacterium]|nr:ABC transporter ATP-binding protein [Deltaproteobacteria bacterium]